LRDGLRACSTCNEYVIKTAPAKNIDKSTEQAYGWSTDPTSRGFGDARAVPRAPWKWEGGVRMWLDKGPLGHRPLPPARGLWAMR
jgi:hypothetical protein